MSAPDRMPLRHLLLAAALVTVAAYACTTGHRAIHLARQWEAQGYTPDQADVLVLRTGGGPCDSTYTRTLVSGGRRPC